MSSMTHSNLTGDALKQGKLESKFSNPFPACFIYGFGTHFQRFIRVIDIVSLVVIATCRTHRQQYLLFTMLTLSSVNSVFAMMMLV